MSEASPHKSHATGWIIGVVLVVYLASSAPVRIYIYNRKGAFPQWAVAVCAFCKPADYLLDSPPLKPLSKKWEEFWLETITSPSLP